jgi:type VI secretion system VasD/TssJ family lipoprotein
LTADENLNPDETGQGMPTLMRVYLLKNTTGIELSSVEDIQRRDREVLAADLIEAREVTLHPGGTTDVDFKRTDDAKAIAVAALFRNPVGNAWRTIAKLPKPNPQHCRSTVPSKSGVRIVVRAKENLLENGS